VPLRELIADLLPIFINPLHQQEWQRLKSYNVIAAFETGDLLKWLLSLPLDIQTYTLTLVRSILEQLRNTGVDREGTTLVIAWPYQNDIQRCLKIPCKAQSRWAQILADSEDCATFAYVTPKCLETDNVKCRGAFRTWQNATKMLATAVSCTQPEQVTAASV
jgi:hypothetical protein